MAEENQLAIQVENNEHHEEGDVTEDAEAVNIIPV